MNMFINYREYINSSEWKSFCAKIRLDRRCCEACGSTTWLNVHHKTYERLGSELLSDVALLCRTCHEALHDFHLMHGGGLFKASNIFIKRMKKGSFKMPTAKMIVLTPPEKKLYLGSKKQRKFADKLKESRLLQEKEKQSALLRQKTKE